jgi:hypothetical protein
MASVQGQSETKTARRPQLFGILLTVGVAALILLAIWMASLLPPPLSYGIWIGLALIPAFNRFSQPCAYLFRGSRMSAVLLNLGCVNKLTSKDVVIYILLAIWWLVLFAVSITAYPGTPYSPAVVILQFGVVVFWIADIATKFLASCEPTLITERGILSPEGMVLWHKIELHQWFKLREDIVLVLKLKGRPWPLEEKKLRVPVSHMADVDRILRERI